MEDLTRPGAHSLYDRYIGYIDSHLNVANRYTSIKMPITLRRTLVKIGGSLRLTIPGEIARLLAAKEGDEIEFATTNGDVIIRRAKK
jgi:AbrB family looped-hinge helix DNA binding protein